MKTLRPYAPPVATTGIDLRLDRNEGRAPRQFSPPAPAVSDLSHYPTLAQLAKQAADRFGVDPESVLVTAGGDDALLRLCLAASGPGARALIAAPTFEMIPRYAQLAGLELDQVAWPSGAFPTDEFLGAARQDTRLAFVVSPNNPTGAVATLSDLERIAYAFAERNPGATVVLDAAYGEFAAQDLTPAALAHDNVIVVRTLSKAWGLAGLRVGYALGSPDRIARLSAAGNPFPVSVASATVALARLSSGRADVEDYVAQAKLESERLADLLDELGAESARPAQANFVLARGLDSLRLRDDLGALGIGIRAFPDREGLEDAVRISVPGDPALFARLERALRTSLRPQALLFDLDGVLADVSGSYRAAIVGTAREFGVELEAREISDAKALGNANDDWALTHKLLTARGISVSLAEVTERFERLYQGSDDVPGLYERERALLGGELLGKLAERFRLAIVTGRPRADALGFLERFSLTEHFEVVVTREDAPLKPDPAPVQLALERLGVQAAWMLGDTPDDLLAARQAGVLPLGVLAPGCDPIRERDVLQSAGAARVLDRTEDLMPLLP